MKEKCYCCNRNAVSREHIPPKCIFPTPRSSNMITVPSCETHNLSKSKDDEYFRWFLSTACAENSQIALDLLKIKVLKGLRRKPALLNEIMRNSIRNIDTFSLGGIWIGKRPGFRFDNKRIISSFKLICRGLHYHHFGQKIIKVQKFGLEFNPNLDNNLKNAITSLVIHDIGNGDVFSYRYYSYKEDNQIITMWFLFFYQTLLVNCIIC